ncbi:hypothetical protein B0H13DRAFT_327011 [Mycena leptocephala]|nr:hypothetical protein B0H13DRAFT_327011 [Mycena leptocephala]
MCMTFTECEHAYCVRCIMTKYEPGTVPFVLRASAAECLKCQDRCNCDKSAKTRSYPERASGQERYPANPDLEQVTIQEPAVYYATMYDCRTCTPIAEIFVGADGADVVQARPLPKMQVPDVTFAAPPTSAASLLTDEHPTAEKLDASLATGVTGLNVATGISHPLRVVAMQQQQPPLAHAASPTVGLDSHAIPGGIFPRPTPSDAQSRALPFTPSPSLNPRSIAQEQTPLSYDDFFAWIRRPVLNPSTAGAGLFTTIGDRAL